MGTIFAPTYATLVMGYLDIKLYQMLGDHFDKDARLYFEEHWKRYLEDYHKFGRLAFNVE